MTRQEMNDLILQSFQDEIADTPDINERIAQSFNTWVQSLIQAGSAELHPQPSLSQAESANVEPVEGLEEEGA